jgi:hypothetical protein
MSLFPRLPLGNPYPGLRLPAVLALMKLEFLCVMVQKKEIGNEAKE